MKQIRFGILSTAKISRETVCPAIQQGKNCVVHAIASQGSLAEAKAYAKKRKIPKVYASYEELLRDKDIDAIYNPLPHHMHVDWTIRALKHNKHVLCEKPLALSSKELQRLIVQSKKVPHLAVMEAFMYRYHPQWIHAVKLVRENAIGKLSLVDVMFSYYNINPKDIRNIKAQGGGALYDIGCYGISISRLLFDDEPTKVMATAHFDKKFKTDILSSVLLTFKQGTAVFSCATQLYLHHNVRIYGDKGYIEILDPFNPPPTRKMEIVLAKTGQEKKTISFPPCNQYTLQAEEFSKAILKKEAVPLSLANSLQNMKVIERVLAQIAK